MGKKKKAILKFKRDGSLGKYKTKFSALLTKSQPTHATEDLEVTPEIVQDDSKLPIVEATEPENPPPKPKPAKRTRKTPNKKATTPRKRRSSPTKADS